MSFKPIDLQVNISQINHVARTQQNEQAHPHTLQAQQQSHLAREAERIQSTVMESAGGKEEGAVKDALARDQGAPHGERRNEERKRESQEELPELKTFEDYHDGEIGSLIDVKR